MLSKYKGLLSSNSSSWALIVILFALVPVFSYFNLPYLDILTRVFIIGLFALSFDLLLGYTGLLNFGQTLFLGMGAYVTAYALSWWGLNYFVALLLSLLVGFGLGILLSFIIQRSFKGIPFTFFSLAFAMIVLSMYQKRLFQGVSGGEGGVGVMLPDVFQSMWALRLFELGIFGLVAVLFIYVLFREIKDFSGLAKAGLLGFSTAVIAGLFYLAVDHLNALATARSFSRIGPNRYYLTLVFLFAFYLLTRRIVSSPVGSVWQSIRENETRVSVIGYNPFTYKMMAVAVSGALAGLAGGLYAPYILTVSASNVFTPFLSIRALVFVVLGGVGTLHGAILGTGIILLLEHFLNPIIGEWTNLLIGILFIVIIFTMPTGIVGKWLEVKTDKTTNRKKTQ